MASPFTTIAEAGSSAITNTFVSINSNAHVITHFTAILEDLKRDFGDFQRGFEDYYNNFADVVDEQNDEIEEVIKNAKSKGEMLMRLVRRRNPARDGLYKSYLRDTIASYKIELLELKAGLEGNLRGYERTSERQRGFLRVLEEEMESFRIVLQCEVERANDPEKVRGDVGI